MNTDDTIQIIFHDNDTLEFTNLHHVWYSRKWGWEIFGHECSITLEPRPTYCDRGNYIAKLHPVGRLAGDIDACDGWPRYYFDLDRAKLEVEAWMANRPV